MIQPGNADLVTRERLFDNGGAGNNKMDKIFIPERLEPVSRIENSGQSRSSSERRSRRQAPTPPRSPEPEEGSDLPVDDEEAGHLNELA